MKITFFFGSRFFDFRMCVFFEWILSGFFSLFDKNFYYLFSYSDRKIVVSG